MTDASAIADTYSNKVLENVGLLFLMAAAVEQALGVQLARLIAHPHHLKSDIMLALQGTEVKVRLLQIQTIARHRVDQKVVPDILRVFGKLRDAYDMRHDFAHNLSISDGHPERVTVRPFRAKNDGSLINPKPYTVEQIAAKTQQLGRLSRELDQHLTRGGIAPIPGHP